jgi:7-cyano-7-deazaguanine tRNA-ribosyltransferase
MSFEIRERDLCARIGRLKTKSGTIETPLLLPVVNPAVQPISPQTMYKAFGCKALITNAYIIKKHFEKEAVQKGIHELLNFDGVIMTDSGAYQILVYGNVELSPKEIIRYQEEINADIATILDVPTGWETSKKHAQKTVKQTIRRARELAKIKTRSDIAWVGPVQGGHHLDLVAQSAKEIGKLPFEIHALGSPTPVMEQYLFDTLVDMIMTAKMNLPLERPLHLFGAGHPFMFALAVALGCDLFDSAAYSIYARGDRYMTTYGTVRLSELNYLPCSCPICVNNDTQNLMAVSKAERQDMLTQHNLYVSLLEIKRVKQAIVEGRLWEHLELRAHGHPSLLQAMKKLKKYEEFMEKQSPITKSGGIFFFSSLGLTRPEVVRHRKRLLEKYAPPKETNILILLPQTSSKPFHKSREHRRTLKAIQQKLGKSLRGIHICTYAAPFGVIPTELDEVYPLSQYEIATPLDAETITYVANQVANYIDTMNYNKVVLLEDTNEWKGKIANACKQACKKKGTAFVIVQSKKPWDESTLKSFAIKLEATLTQP